MGNYVWPCPKYSRISSYFGYRVPPFPGASSNHDGVDLAAVSGTSIIAFGPGTVTMAGWNGGYGNYISIDHGGGLMSFYGHCLELYVSKGAKVKAGQKIAAVGTTGSSSGCHLHFGMHKNGSGVDPLGYVKDSDTISNYTGKSGASAQNIVKAMFTAYYPANNAMEGGFLDALGNPLDTSKRTCAAPKSVPFGTKVTVQGTNSELDGVTYTVNDRGGMITIENGVYHFDLLMSTEAECNRWGVKYGTAAIGGDGVAEDGAAEEKKTKEITKVVVKSTTGAAGKHKEALRNQPAYLQNGVDILIQNRNNVLQSPSIKGDVVWDTARRGVVAEIYGGQG